MMSFRASQCGALFTSQVERFFGKSQMDIEKLEKMKYNFAEKLKNTDENALKSWENIGINTLKS